MNEINVLIKETSESTLFFSTIGGQNEKTMLHEPGIEPFPELDRKDTLISDLQLQNVRNKCFLLSIYENVVSLWVMVVCYSIL